MKNQKNDQTQTAIQGINLKAIQRQVDSKATEVKFTTPRCAIYEFIGFEQSGKWKKTDVEGSLFIYEFERDSPDSIQATTLHKMCPDLHISWKIKFCIFLVENLKVF